MLATAAFDCWFVQLLYLQTDSYLRAAMDWGGSLRRSFLLWSRPLLRAAIVRLSELLNMKFISKVDETLHASIINIVPIDASK